jgi:hypothetical protein
MYNKNNLAVAKVASRNGIKAELQCVAFYGNRTMATDSFRAIEVSARGKKLDTPTLFYADDVKKVKLKKGEFIDDQSIPIEPCAVHPDRYPDLDKAMKSLQAESYTEIQVNAELLEGLLSVMKNIDDRFSKVTLKVPNQSYKPLIITAENLDPKNVQSATALLMPFNR